MKYGAKVTKAVPTDHCNAFSHPGTLKLQGSRKCSRKKKKCQKEVGSCLKQTVRKAKDSSKSMSHGQTEPMNSVTSDKYLFCPSSKVKSCFLQNIQTFLVVLVLFYVLTLITDTTYSSSNAYAMSTVHLDKWTHAWCCNNCFGKYL